MPAAPPRGNGSPARQRAATLSTFFSHGLLFASWTAHIPAVKADIGLTDATLGLILLGTPIGSVVAMLLAARLLPRLGSVALVRICLLAYCASGPLVGLAASPVELAAALFAWGASQGSLDISMNTQGIAIQVVQRRQLMPTFHGAWSLGALGGAGIGAAAVAAHVSLGLQMLILAVPVLAVAAMLTPSMVGDRPARDEHEHVRARGLWRNPAVIRLGLIGLAAMLCEGAVADWSAVYLRGPAHAPAAVAGLGYTVFAFLMAASRLLGTPLLARFRGELLLPALGLIGAAGMTAALISSNAVVGLIGFGALGVGIALVVPLVFSAAGHMPELPAGIAAVSSWAWIGFLCGPPLIGQLAGAAGLRGALVIVPVLTLLVALGLCRPLGAGGAALQPR